MWRQLSIDAIKADPAWRQGDYQAQPAQGLRTAASLNLIAGSAPINWQTEYPTRAAAAAFAQERVATSLKSMDANDYIYQLEASRTYNPWPNLERITAPMMWINSADDFINPRNLTFPQQALKRMPSAKFRLIPESVETKGHSTHTWAKFWKADLAELLARSGSVSR
jgi:homoserine O-acetyltransferase